jgi:hypothetical protein
LRKDERMIVRWLLRIVGDLIGIIVAVEVYDSTLSKNISSGVSPDQSATTSLIFAIVVLAAWIGVLEVVVRLGLDGGSSPRSLHVVELSERPGEM